ncbi:MAG: preprotein translocase subunit YajC [Chromatiales bacterium]|nr:preprotein translocase subunit YajC [Chromatiales bacterium]
MSFLISDALAQDGAQPQMGIGGLLFPIILIVIFYFLLIRPQMKRQKEHRALVDALSKGDEVSLDGGVLGKIAAIDDQYVTLEVADGVQIIARRGAVNAVLPKNTLKDLRK